jgi:hypothetical protein
MGHALVLAGQTKRSLDHLEQVQPTRLRDNRLRALGAYLPIHLPTFPPSYLTACVRSYVPIYLTPWHPHLLGYLAHLKPSPPPWDYHTALGIILL